MKFLQFIIEVSFDLLNAGEFTDGMGFKNFHLRTEESFL